jgi:hypothetical protein
MLPPDANIVHRTLIDLPGLIHSSNKSQSEEDVELIRSLVKSYISKQRTIMLAIISAKNDYANQIILKMCREFDNTGSRTLGIITKPDFLRPGSENEAAWLNLASNQDVYFELGWHLLKNRADDQHGISFHQRNAEEQMFFKTGKYTALPRSIMGVGFLRDRLSQLLFDHLRRGLPELKEELETMLSNILKELESLGQSREGLAEQRIFLADLATSATNIIRMGCDGNYDASFFGHINVDVAVDAAQNAFRLRAVVQHLNIRFADQIRLRGHTFNIEKKAEYEQPLEEETWMDAFSSTKQKSRKSAKKPVQLKRHQAIRWIDSIQERIRGRELPGLFNPLIIGHIFQEQSVDWEHIARKHVDVVADVRKKFVMQVLSSMGAPEVREKLSTLTVLPFLKQTHLAAIRELERILEDKSRHPITYNHYFTDTIQKSQQERYTGHLMEKTRESRVRVTQKTFLGGSGFEEKEYIDPSALEQGFQRTIEQNMSKFAAEQALDAHEAFYKVCFPFVFRSLYNY